MVASLPLACVSLDDDESADLLRFMSDSDAPFDDSRTGVLGEEDFDILAGLCRYVNDAWQLDADMPPYLERLQADLRFKTSERPSYLAEYENAIGLFRLVERRTSSVEGTWGTLLFAELDAADLASTRLGRARRFVFAELIAHQIPLSGAFKSFGLWNYSGYHGGPYTSADSYRRSAP